MFESAAEQDRTCDVQLNRCKESNAGGEDVSGKTVVTGPPNCNRQQAADMFVQTVCWVDAKT